MHKIMIFLFKQVSPCGSFCILHHLPEKGRKWTEELVEKWKDKHRGIERKGSHETEEILGTYHHLTIHTHTLKKICISPDKRKYPHSIFLISARKHLLWVLIRNLNEALRMSTHNISCFH